MISCEQCQNKLVAVFDNEGSESDKELTNAHLGDCPACRAFRDDMVRIRKRFISAAVPYSSKASKKQLMQVIQADSLRGDNRLDDNESKHRPLLLRFPRLVWAAGLAALFLITTSWVVSFNLAQKVKALKQELETSRKEIALAKEKEQLEDAQERQHQAVSELRIRVKELERQVQRGISPRMAWQSESPYYRPERPGGM